MTTSHLQPTNHQTALAHHYQQHGYVMPASCSMGLERLDAAAVGFAAACAGGRPFATPSPFGFTPAHRISATYYDAIRQAGFDSV